MATIQGVYLALFGRPADPAGLAYFNGLTNNGANLAAISNLSGQPEYLSRFTGLTNEQIVNTIFQSLFGRDAEPAGLSFYVGQLAAGKLSINTIAINILDGAAGADKTTIDAKIAAANLFTNSLDTPAEIAAYTGDAAAALARNYISGINANNPGTEAGVNAVIQNVVTNSGQDPNEGGGGGGGGGGLLPEAASLVEGVLSIQGSAKLVVTGDVATVSAGDGFRGFSFSMDDVTKIAIGDNESLTVDGSLPYIVNGGEIEVATSGKLIFDVHFEALSAANPALVGPYIANVHTPGEDGTNDPETMWNLIDVANGSAADKFKLFWNWLDKRYYSEPSYYNMDLNTAKVHLAEIYVDYLKENPPILDVVQTKVGGVPDFGDRQQSLHDNILGEITNAAILDRFPGADPRSDDALFYGERPYESGGAINAVTPADLWDLINNVDRSGDLVVTQKLTGFAHEGLTWETDRAAVDSDDSSGNSITFNINEAGPSDASSFYRYQGQKFLVDDQFIDIGHNSIVSYDFAINGAWTDDGKSQSSGAWIQLQKDGETGESTRAYSIAEYLDEDAAIAAGHSEAGFRFYDSTNGWANFFAYTTENANARLDFVFTENAGIWYIDGKEAYRDTSATYVATDEIETVIFNSRNYGNDENYTYSNLNIIGVEEQSPVT